MMDKSRIMAAVQKALIAAKPDYFASPQQAQEQFRANLHGSAESKVEAMLLKELLGIQCSPEEADTIWHGLPLSKLDNLNWARLLTTGIGDDYIYLNESMADNTSLLYFNTLYEYDYDDYLFQERSNKAEFDDYKGRDYYAFGFPRWARLIIDNRFYYATLYSLAGYLIDAIEDKGYDCIQSLIPHQYVAGKENGKRETGGFRWDMQTDANGKEKQLDELKSRWFRYTQQRWIELSKEFVNQPAAVYTEELDIKAEHNRNYLFNNEATLKQVRWAHFLSDCESLWADFTRVTNRIKQEIARANTYLQQAHEDIIKNFDPNIVKLKKRTKIIIAPGAFDGLTDNE